MKNKLPLLSNITLAIGALLGVYALADIYLIKSRVPAGVCPVITNRPILYVAIGLCIFSFILSFFEPKKAE